jgi:hypothetical protein
MESAYEPSRFARRYEAHKRASGWYADDPGRQDLRGEPPWYPPMFQGRDYALYETLMESYATALATDLAPEAINPDWIPYFPTVIDLDPVRHLARAVDPVWPHHRFLPPKEWEIMCLVNGIRSIGEIVIALRREPAALNFESVARALWLLRVEGFVLFRTG